MLRHLFTFVFIVLSGLSSGCAHQMGANRSALRIKSVDRPLGELRALVTDFLPVGLRARSPNGREFLSRHFVVESRGVYKDAGDAVDRYFAQVLVLGDRRPYDVEILVTKEKRVLRGNQFSYAIVGFDTRLAKELEKSLLSELTKSREDSNIIDDFRVF